MSLAKWIQQAWHHQSAWLIVLRPLSYVYRAAFLYQKKQYQSGKKPIYQAPIPVMVIGNITIGGSGKTPLLIQLVKHLTAQNIRVGVISRGYGGQGPFPRLVVNGETSALDVGDEPACIVAATGVPMAVGPNRQQDIELLLQSYSLDLIISDDGLQHWALARQIEWIVVDEKRGFGNQRLLPEGFLREPISRLQNSTVIHHYTKAMDKPTPYHMYLEVGQPYLLNPTDASPTFDPTQRFHGVVGIGYPERFFASLAEIGVIDVVQHAFPDHHAYTETDIRFTDALPLITTEKDAIKLQQLLTASDHQFVPIWVLPVEAVLSEPCYTLLHQQLNDCHLSGH